MARARALHSPGIFTDGRCRLSRRKAGIIQDSIQEILGYTATQRNSGRTDGRTKPWYTALFGISWTPVGRLSSIRQP